MAVTSSAVSVAVPLFQKARYVERALRSILAQTHRDFTVLVVDDGSTDDGAARVAALADPRVRIVRQPNAGPGPGAARNRALHETAAAWVAFLDADDEWHPRLLERLLAAARPGLQAVFADLRTPRSGPLLGSAPGRGGEVADYFSLLLRSGGVGMTSQATLVSRSALLAAGGFPEGVAEGEDADAWARLAWSGPVAYVPEVLAVYHSECSTRPSRTAAPVAPPVLGSYAAWRAAGRIPGALARSSDLYANWVRTQYAIDLLHAGRRGEGLEVLGQCRPSAHARRLWLTAWARVPLPIEAVDRARTLWRRLVGRHPASVG